MTVIDRVELIGLACVFHAEVNQVIARQARKQGHPPPAHGFAHDVPQPFVTDIAGVQAKILTARDEPEHDIRQAQGQQKTRPSLPALMVPAAPEQNRCDQPAPHDRCVEPGEPRQVLDPPHLLEAEDRQHIDQGHDRRHKQGRPVAREAKPAKLIGLACLFSVRIEHEECARGEGCGPTCHDAIKPYLMPGRRHRQGPGECVSIERGRGETSRNPQRPTGLLVGRLQFQGDQEVLR